MSQCFKFLVLIFLFCLLPGCATTEYSQREGSLWGSGYYDKKIQEGVYKVGYTGNGSTRADMAEDLALLRGADVALQNSYNYFIIVNRTKATNVNSSYTPLMPYSYKGNTYYSGGYSTNTYTPDIELTIKCFVNKPLDTREIVYDANEIKNNLGAKYAKKEKGVAKSDPEPVKVNSAPAATANTGVSAEDRQAANRAFDEALN